MKSARTACHSVTYSYQGCLSQIQVETAVRSEGPVTAFRKPTQWNTSRAGVTGPDNDQDHTTTTLFGHSLVLKFQDQTTTTWVVIV